jgi:hypothetical protein
VCHVNGVIFRFEYQIGIKTLTVVQTNEIKRRFKKNTRIGWLGFEELKRYFEKRDVPIITAAPKRRIAIKNSLEPLNTRRIMIAVINGKIIYVNL